VTEETEEIMTGGIMIEEMTEEIEGTTEEVAVEVTEAEVVETEVEVGEDNMLPVTGYRYIKNQDSLTGNPD
jgi:hypothetical protein